MEEADFYGGPGGLNFPKGPEFTKGPGNFWDRWSTNLLQTITDIGDAIGVAEHLQVVLTISTTINPPLESRSTWPRSRTIHA